jgi:hypothetical protein
MEFVLRILVGGVLMFLAAMLVFFLVSAFLYGY